MSNNTKNISCYYGFENNFIDVTNIVLNKFKRNNLVIIPKNCNFNSFFGYPFEGKLKELIINIDSKKYKIPENSLNNSITFCLLKGKLDIIERDIILVTGGCGFIGSNFINYMVKKYSECDFINIDCLYYCSSENNITVNNKNNYFFEKGDINDTNFIMNILNKYSINKIIHFAAQSHVDNSFSNPMQYTKDNIMGTQNLLECCRNYGNIKKFVHVSTDEVYGESHLNSTNKKTELDLLCPTNPYAASKAGAEMIVNAYHFSYNLPIIITRGNNVYGKNQYPEKLIPKFITMLNNNKKVTIHGNGENKRSFVHVDDVVRAFDIILDRGKIGDIYNIGSDDTNEYSINDIAKILINIIKPDDVIKDWLSYESDRNFNDFRYHIDNSKLRSLGWEQCVDFKDSLISLVHWYTREINYIKHWDIRKALNITFFCDTTKYNYYQDYIESIIRNISNSQLILYVRNEDILHYMKKKINHIYIFIQSIPNIKLHKLVNQENTFILNVEQLSIPSYKKYMRKVNNITKIIDYSKSNLKHLENQNNLYLPYQVNEQEIFNYEKTNDVAFIGTQSEYRTSIINKLKKNGINVDIINGWYRERDEKLLRYKIILNIHYNENYKIFEEIRCNRCIFNKMIVITQTSENMEDYPLRKYIIEKDYDDLVDTVVDVLNNYKNIHKELFQDFDLNELKEMYLDNINDFCKNLLTYYQSMNIKYMDNNYMDETDYIY